MGLKLALHRFDWKTSKADKEKKTPVSIAEAGSGSESGASAEGGKTLNWSTGNLYSECQNLARELQDTPANLMTPTIFAERAKKEFEGVANVTVNVHDECEPKITLPRGVQLKEFANCQPGPRRRECAPSSL